MNLDIIKGNWSQFKGKAQQKWGKLNDDDLTLIEGNFEEFVGRIQERYGISKQEAEEQIEAWEKEVS